jgi:hypothetical protein
MKRNVEFFKSNQQLTDFNATGTGSAKKLYQSTAVIWIFLLLVALVLTTNKFKGVLKCQVFMSLPVGQW